MASTGGPSQPAPETTVITMEEGLAASPSTSAQPPQPPQSSRQRLSNLALSLRSPGILLHVVRVRPTDRMIDDRPGQFEREPTRSATLNKRLIHRPPPQPTQGSIDEEMDDFTKHEGSIEAEAQENEDLEASVAGLPSCRERAVAFEDGGRLGRFKVTKRVGLPLGEAATGHGAAGGSIINVPVVVVLFGWLTCQDRHLKKYAELYHRLGFPLVLRVGASYSRIIFNAYL